MNLLDIIMQVFIGLALVSIGCLIGAIVTEEQMHNSVLVLTEKTQDQFWLIQGLEQKIIQYERGDFREVIIPLCSEYNEQDLSKGRLN